MVMVEYACIYFICVDVINTTFLWASKDGAHAMGEVQELVKFCEKISARVSWTIIDYIEQNKNQAKVFAKIIYQFKNLQRTAYSIQDGAWP